MNVRDAKDETPVLQQLGITQGSAYAFAINIFPGSG